MKFVRWGEAGAEKPGVLDADGKVRDLSGVVADIDGTTLATMPEITPETLPLAGDVRLGPCVGSVGKLVCVGLNYADHAAEGGWDVPTEPVLFMKATTSISGPNDPVILPPGSEKTDWEAELAFVIGTRAKNTTDGAAHIAGYFILNDISERAWQQEHGGQWTKGKSHDTFAPMGPWLVTPDELGAPTGRAIWLEVDGKRMQDGTTDTMIFKPDFIVEYISRFMTLEPGDVVTTGTPPGVGLGKSPQVFLRAGQEMRLGIDGLGEQRLPVQGA
ncbi:fumarylacetoacetate hydrolase family protein [Rhodobacteraceae bacterium N5(2021)]|uniref:Fumarylacetoacetate hydrolase family protein n=1 Tax=Gymnodinialimonas phycosphaerae TaxID=2841589 RepID=A0A975TS43_9RHOB|nr:fumarylacetoacetate hydrolase family protein [Gymnodinialimonas phycosphaerae]MBY4893793.1 fumarylacetoacetate hydrolase family protein [Gymnodinialimonas phycosphaerae]